MTDDTTQRLQNIRSKQLEAARRRATAEAKLDNVRSQRERLLAGLKEQGFDTVEAAAARTRELESETREILDEIEQLVS